MIASKISHTQCIHTGLSRLAETPAQRAAAGCEGLVGQMHCVGVVHGAYAEMHLVAVPLEVVIERQLLPSDQVLGRKQADRELALHEPLLRLAVGLARVVDKPPQRALQTSRVGVRAAPCLYTVALSRALEQVL